MPRKKEFDVDEVLDKAMNAFWVRGYEATSLNDLLDCMKIQRASLYNAFGNKHTLFLETLRRYDVVYRRADVARRVNTPSPRQAILDLFQDRITMVVKHGSRNGCLLINTALDSAPHDEEVAAFVCGAFTHMEQQFFRKMIKKGQALGEIAKTVSSTQTARALLSLFIGLIVLSRSRPEPRLMQSIARQAETLIPPGDKTALPLGVPVSSATQVSIGPGGCAG